MRFMTLNVCEKNWTLSHIFLLVFIGDDWARPVDTVNKLLFVTGKHYYALHKQRMALGLINVAIIRLEELCPFPTYYLQQQLELYKNAKRKQ